jgi:hypothetical protein
MGRIRRYLRRHDAPPNRILFPIRPNPIAGDERILDRVQAIFSVQCGRQRLLAPDRPAYQSERHSDCERLKPGVQPGSRSPVQGIWQALTRSLRSTRTPAFVQHEHPKRQFRFCTSRAAPRARPLIVMLGQPHTSTPNRRRSAGAGDLAVGFPPAQKEGDPNEPNYSGVLAGGK